MNTPVTESDVIAGKKTISVRRRDGSAVEIQVNALDWRNAVKVNAAFAQNRTDDAAHIILQVALSKEQASDSFLNELEPVELFNISTLVMKLSGGVSALRTKSE